MTLMAFLYKKKTDPLTFLTFYHGATKSMILINMLIHFLLQQR